MRTRQHLHRLKDALVERRCDEKKMAATAPAALDGHYAAGRVSNLRSDTSSPLVNEIRHTSRGTWKILSLKKLDIIWIMSEIGLDFRSSW